MILSAIPVCLIGVTAALLIGGVRLNIFSLMAMIMLVGMVVNNAIIVLDYAMREERKDQAPLQRIREACRVRFRVIIMANSTTIVAMIPLSLGLGFAGEIFRPLAVVQMGGIFAAATLSMVVIPAVYMAIENWRKRG
jgi:HAE1 family hydrophobic/amphiphilic exporter-1